MRRLNAVAIPAGRKRKERSEFAANKQWKGQHAAPLPPRRFTAHLAGPIQTPFVSSVVVGNLNAEEARTFFMKHVAPFRKLPPGAHEAWPRVYEVCGGNPGLLRKCASEVARFRSWELGALCMQAVQPCSASS